MEKLDLRGLLDHIDPAIVDYQGWTAVGMALKEEGYTVADWESWSARDPTRYNKGECVKKWQSFNGSADPVTGGTIYQMAVEQGWMPQHGHELDWNDTIRAELNEDGVVVDGNWVEEVDIEEPAEWDPAQQVIEYLETLFEAGDNVGYVMQSYRNDKGKWTPGNKGNYDRTAGQLIEALKKCGGDIGAVLGDYNGEGGAWIRFNPLDGQGVRNANVTDFRYALVESDELPVAKQNAILRELELPIAALVFSGGKSLHAIVRVDASDINEYKTRVNYLYEVCGKNGLKNDTNNRNPSRLSRLPGVMRNGRKQFIVATNIGRKDWDEWKEWIDGVNDDLPEVQSLSSVWDSLPPLSGELIGGVLRKGHKMLLVGPSKSGKSFLQIELCIAIAEGVKWLKWQCTKGSVLYVNLELDHASCLHRFRDVYDAMGLPPKNVGNIDIWNLRGKSVPMDRLAPRLIRRAQKKDYAAVIIDPIYKVITGDENSADQMARFCNQFDKICSELGCSVIYCHHHSKGAQGGKRSMDRASGSGVFARDPDALLDMIQLETTDALMRQEANKAACMAVRFQLENEALTSWDWREDISQDDWLNIKTLLNICENNAKKFISPYEFGMIKSAADAAGERARKMTAWRIEGTLREFPLFEPINVWFDYPAHTLDESGALGDIQPEDPFTNMQKKRKDMTKEHWVNKLNEIEIAFEGLSKDGEPVRMGDIAEQIGIDAKTLGKWFGEGNDAKPEFKKRFKKHQPEKGGKMFIMRVGDDENDTP